MSGEHQCPPTSYQTNAYLANGYGIPRTEESLSTYGPSRLAKTLVTSPTLHVPNSRENNFVPSFSSGPTYSSGCKVRGPYKSSSNNGEPPSPQIPVEAIKRGNCLFSIHQPLHSSRECFYSRRHGVVAPQPLSLLIEVLKQKSAEVHHFLCPGRYCFLGLELLAVAERLGLEGPTMD